MLKGIDVSEVIQYSAKEDTAEQKTVFFIGNISNRQKMKMFSNVVKGDGSVDISVIQDKAIDIFIAGVKKVENLDGKTYDKVDEELADRIPFPTLIEVVGKVIEYNFVQEQELKN